MTDMGKMIFDVGSWLIPLVIAIVFHEVAHGRVARYFGDLTAANLGRLSLNPIRHVDPFGTVILPMLLAITGAPMFGWAKPVPVRQSQLRNPRWHMVLVAAAGPAINLILAAVAAMLLGFLASVISDNADNRLGDFIAANFVNFIQINLFLAVFNMLPLPPFDGSKVLAGFLPPALALKFQSLDRYALIILLILLVGIPRLVPGADVIGNVVVPPVQWLMGGLVELVRVISGAE
jgi:Zn-dependent protease